MNQKNVSLLLAAGMALSLAARAQVVIEYSPNKVISTSTYYEFTGTSFYSVNSVPGSGFNFAEPYGLASLQIDGFGGGESSLAPITFGQPISSSTSFTTGNNANQVGSQFSYSSVSDNYFELKDTIGGSTYYGWCEIQAGGNYGEGNSYLVAIAMDTTPGDTNFTIGGVPEPSTVALGALGLGGLVAARRRAKQ